MGIKVNGEVVEVSAIRAEAERMRARYEEAFSGMEPGQREAQLLDWSRENVVERVLVKQEAVRRGGEIPKQQVDSALKQLKKDRAAEDSQDEIAAEREAQLRKEIEEQLRVERLLDDVCSDAGRPSEQGVAECYEQNKERFKTADMVRAGHIVKHVNWLTGEKDAYETIKKAQDELNKGAVFEDLVRKYSDCPENDGDLGYIGRGQMAEEFEDIVFNLDVGKVSDIFRTRFGYHIARVYDRKPSITRSIDEVREQIVSELAEQMRSEAINTFVDELKAEAAIEEVQPGSQGR